MIPRSFAASVVVAALVALVVAACSGPTGADGPTPDGMRSSARDESSARPSADAATPTASDPGQTETEWGRIWDTLPPGFPTYPGSRPTDTGGGPATAVLDAPADVRTVTEWFQAALEHAGYSTLALSGPLEDGSMEIDSMGPIPECLVHTAIAPLGGETIVTILYGAECPAA